MNIVLKDKIKIDNNFITDLVTKSWQDSENIQNQINSIEIDSPQAAKVVKLLKDLLTSYYVFTGCLENLENEPTAATEPEQAQQEVQIKEPMYIANKPIEGVEAQTVTLDEFESKPVISEPFEYFIDFDEPAGEPLTDKDLYN